MTSTAGSSPSSDGRDMLPPASGKIDLLLRFFDSQFFDEWIALTYLYKSNSPGVQDYLCNRLYTLPEAGIERYLSQLCQLVFSRPQSSLERVLVDLCARSLRIALKVYWLLLAISQDHPKNHYIVELRDACERAAYEGYWEPPFRAPKLLPLSPAGSRSLASPPMSPARGGAALTSPRLSRRNSFQHCQVAPPVQGQPRYMSPDLRVPAEHRDARTPLMHGRPSSPDLMSRPTSPDGLGNGIHSSYTLGQGLEGLICNSPPAVSSSRRRVAHSHSAGAFSTRAELLLPEGEPLSPVHHAERLRHLRAELGEGEGVSALLRSSARALESGDSGVLRPGPPLSADDLDLLSTPSSPRLRQSTFGATLDFIEALCDASNHLVQFGPSERAWALRSNLEMINLEMERASRSGVAIWFPMGNSNERVVRVAAKEAIILNSRDKAPFLLLIEVLSEHAGEQDHAGQQNGQQNGTRAAIEGEVPQANGVGAAPRNGLYHDAEASVDPARTLSNGTAGPGPGSLQQQNGGGSRAGPRSGDGYGGGSEAEGSLSRSHSLRKQLSFDSAANGHANGSPRSGSFPGHARKTENGAPAVDLALQPSGRLAQSQTIARPPREDSFQSGLTAALEGLQGKRPAVTVRLEVIDNPIAPGTPGGQRRAAAEAAGGAEAHAKGLMCRLGLCRVCNLRKAEEDGVEEPAEVIKLHLKVHGGVDLRLGVRSSPAHRRVPSSEALAQMAGQVHAPVQAPRPAPTPQPIEPSLPVAVPEPAGSLPFPDPGLPSQVNLQRVERLRIESLAAEVRSLGGGGDAGGSGSGSVRGSPAATVAQLQEARRVARNERLQREALAVYGERFEDKCRRVQRESPYGRRRGWAVRPVIVKSGDDCRQELMAMQLINAFHDIYKEAGLSLWLRPYEVLVTSNRTALIEFIPDSLSIHAVKAKSPPGTSLRDHFFAKFIKGTPECQAAQRKFADSMAGYSLLAYLLQIKDRHNGNVMVDSEGHCIHIDFGFMLSNSPGGVNFEAAPFKLTREYVEVLDSDAEGHPSELFDYYKVLCIQGFLALRKHADRIILLVEMMAGSGCPAFKAGPRVVQQLRRRFHLNLTDSQCVEVVLGMIAESLDSWRTRQYDYYQRILNGIL